MKEDNKPVEQKLGNSRQKTDHTSVRKNIEPLEKKEIKKEDKTAISGDSAKHRPGIEE